MFLKSVFSHCARIKKFHLSGQRLITRRSIHVEHLKRRALLQLSGPDTSNYLQGLVTNDVLLFKPKPNNCSIYTLLLNSHGRVLYDCLLYKMNENNYYIEYDLAAIDYLRKHLNMYRLRKNVVCQHVKDILVYVAYNIGSKESELQNLVDSLSHNDQIVLTSADPRVKELGYRILTKTSDSVKDLVKYSESNNEESYDTFRYKLGIGEGVIDHPPGNCLPFETNVDFLNGINFHKGCYVGQELTARVHFTGVVRKRLMPVILASDDDQFPNFPLECAIVNEKGQKLGKLRNHVNEFGLATLNVSESLKAERLEIKDFNVKVNVIKPYWWPSDVNKTN